MRRSTPRRRPARTAAVLALTGLAATMAAPAYAAAHDPQPGASGIGDPYYPDYGNGGYDVGHYGLKLKYQPKTDRLDGTATIAARATQDLSRFDLDFALDTKSVTVDGAPAKFARSGDHELVITPAKPLYKDRPFTAVVTYTGVPSSVQAEGFTSWMRTPDGGVAANEPESAWWWFPSNDHPADKATFDVDVSVPEGTQAISNGLRTSEATRNGWTRSTWHQDRPQATYLATLALGKFDIHMGKSPSGIPSITAYSTDLGSMAANAKASVERTGEIIDFESTYFGKYPFNSTGGYVPNVTAKYSIETETRPFFGPTDFFTDAPDTYVVAHENAHQWFGDGVSLTRWKDIWLNEGFATYAEWLWSDHLGEGTPAQLAAQTYASYPADDPFWTVLPGDPGPAKQFDDAVYDRGALTLQALRDTVGDRDFFTILRTWAQSKKYGNGTTPQFVALAEKISGKQLDSLFNTWLYTPSRPSAPAAKAAGLDAAPAATPKSWDQIQATHRALGTTR